MHALDRFEVARFHVQGEKVDESMNNMLRGLYSLTSKIVISRSEAAPGFSFPVYGGDNIPLCLVVSFEKARELISQKTIDAVPPQTKSAIKHYF